MSASNAAVGGRFWITFAATTTTDSGQIDSVHTILYIAWFDRRITPIPYFYIVSTAQFADCAITVREKQKMEQNERMEKSN